MARPKILYFTAGDKPTGPEQTAIDALLAGQYDVQVRNASEPALYGTKAEPCDYKAGSAPAGYESVPAWTGGNLLPSTQAIVTNGQKITGVTGTGTVANIVVNPTTKAVTINLTAS